MAVKYDKLYKVIADRKIKLSALSTHAGVSRNIMTRIKRNEYISLESIEKKYAMHLIARLMILSIS